MAKKQSVTEFPWDTHFEPVVIKAESKENTANEYAVVAAEVSVIPGKENPQAVPCAKNLAIAIGWQ